jgi:outer membrane protein
MIRGKKPIQMLILLLFFIGSVFGQTKTIDAVDLQRLITAALKTNPGIKEGMARTDISNKEINLSKSVLFPRVSTNASYTFTNQNSTGSNYGSASTGLTIDQVLWQNGKNMALIKQSEFLHKARLSDLETQKQELILNVKFSYHNLIRYKQLKKLSKNDVIQAELFLEAAQEKNELGVGQYSDILKAKSELADAQYQLQSMNYALENVENELERLTGLIIVADLISTDTVASAFTNYEAFEVDSLFNIAISNYPELKSLENLELSQEFFIKSVKSEMFPQVSAGAGYNWYYDPLFKDNDVWNAGLSIRWNIFEGKRRKNQIEIEQLRKQSYQFQKEDLLAELKREIADRLISIRESREKISISKVLMQSTTENLEMLEEQYKQGTSSMLELTNARTDDFAAKAKYINAITDYELSKAQLERIIGKTMFKSK